MLDVLVIGAGAAGLMCGITAAARGCNTLIIDKANKPGKKILMSGGGRCNFTNLHTDPSCYISHNPHFCISALRRYTQWDFIELVKRHHIPYHEKTLGQLFCDNSSKDIVNMLLSECQTSGAQLQLNTRPISVTKVTDRHFIVQTDKGSYESKVLVIATGGLSIPSMGASGFAYDVARQFGLKVWPTRAGLVPFTVNVTQREKFAELAGVSLPVTVKHAHTQFQENLLWTHRGLSGPAILQISSYWHAGECIDIDMLPSLDLDAQLATHSRKRQLKTALAEVLPKRVVQAFIPEILANLTLGEISKQQLIQINQLLHAWQFLPEGTEGYRTAEVTLGGIDCSALSSKTMECQHVKGLYFIGEAVDVTGWLGGYNFQWAWASGYAAGQATANSLILQEPT